MAQDPHPHERLTLIAHDRLHVRRDDADWLAQRWREPSSRALVVAGNRVRTEQGRVAWVHPSEAPEGHRILLGDSAGATRFAVVVPAGDDAGGTLPDEVPDEEWASLRALLPLLAEGTGEGTGEGAGEAALLLHAIGLAEWLAVTRFCPRCGRPLSLQAAGHQLACEEGHLQFPRSDPAVIMLITDGVPGADDERCLLARQTVWPQGRFSTLAGFCEPGESLEGAVRREVAEETGVRVGEVSYFGNQPWPLPASLMLGFTGRAVSTDVTVDDDEIAEARWFTRAQLREAAGSGEIRLPSGISISRSLVQAWYGGPLPGTW